jgi:uncharacterized membrane protein YeaQ/YmgE (transglycosylase-associated protein family)
MAAGKTVTMKKDILTWSVFGGLVGALLGLGFGKGDPRAPVFVAAMGVVLGVLGSLVVRVLHRATGADVSKRNTPALIGALIGSVAGGVIGAYSGFGRIMIAIFNPDLMERDFGMSFGAIGGVFLGAMAGACLAALTAVLLLSDADKPRSDPPP